MRTPSRPMVLGAVAWLAVVAVVATLVWVVISRAGAGLGDDDAFQGTAGTPSSTSGTPSDSPSSREPSASPSASATPSGSPSATGQPAPGDAEPVQRSANGAGGTVTVSCSGAVASLVGATPSGGYGAEVEDSGPDRVRVDFENDDRRTRIEATCPDGAPAFSVEED